MISVNIQSSKLILPHFRPYLDSNEEYQFFVGTAGSGKSHFIVQRALIKAMQPEPFRMIFSRKTHESIRDSQFQLFKDYIKAWGLEKLFHVKEQPMDIHCINGNSLFSSGLDNEEIEWDNDKVCPNCNEKVQPGWKACPACGDQIPAACPTCGASIKPNWKACPACGNHL